VLSLDDVPFPGPAEWVEGLVEGRRGTLVHQKPQRAVWRVEEDGRTWYAKRGNRAKAREIAREARWLERLLRADVPVSRLIAAGLYAGGYWVVTDAVPGRALHHPLREAVLAGDAPRVRRLLAAAAHVARRLHDEGFRLPDLTAAHILVDESTDSVAASLIDVARTAAPMGGVGPSARAQDLAALLFSLPYEVGRGARARLLREATGGRGDALRSLTRRIDSAVRHLALRTRWRHGFAGASVGVRTAITALRGEEPDDLYDALMDPSGMEVVRTLPDRENRRFDAPDGTTYFMKTYPPVTRGMSPAMDELRGIDRLSRAGVPVCRHEAYGEDVDRGSFVVVRGCPGEPLDDLLRAGSTPAERRALAIEVAAMYSGMRAARLRHRDAYPCHVFVDRLAPGGDGAPRFSMRLIDLTRAGRAPHPRERWYVKDAAQLLHGIPDGSISRTDALRWLRAYFGIERLDPRARRFARRVVVKEARIRRRQERKARERRGE
jgi:tRNA A-37 threonylcarbamoyl transferase component Bud32